MIGAALKALIIFYSRTGVIEGSANSIAKGQ